MRVAALTLMGDLHKSGIRGDVNPLAAFEHVGPERGALGQSVAVDFAGGEETGIGFLPALHV